MFLFPLTVCVCNTSICVYVSMCNVNLVTAFKGQKSIIGASLSLYTCVKRASVTGGSCDNLVAKWTSQDPSHSGHKLFFITVF